MNQWRFFGHLYVCLPVCTLTCLPVCPSVRLPVCPSVQSPGGSASEIFAKLEVYLWLGLAKYSKEVTTCLPEEFLPVYEEEEGEPRRLVTAGKRKLPVTLSCQGESAGWG